MHKWERRLSMPTQGQISAMNAQENKRHNLRQEAIDKEKNAIAERDSKRRERVGYQTSGRRLTGDVIRLFSSVNDPSWYNKVPQLVKDSSSFSFAEPLGVPTAVNSVGTAPTDKRILPGFMVLNFFPTVGTLNSVANSEIDSVAKALYAAVRKTNSGGANYEADNLFMYTFAVATAMEFWAESVRAYSVLNTYKQENKYFGETLAEALGFSPDISSELANFRTAINQFALKLNSIAIPKNIPLIDRWIWLGGGIFKDAPVKKSQNYYFHMPYRAVYSSTQMAVNYKTFGTTTNQITSTADYRAATRIIIDGLLNNTEFGNINGDVAKRFPESTLYRLPIIPEDYHIEAFYSAEVLSEISGATICGSHRAPASGNSFGTAVIPSLGMIATGTYDDGAIDRATINPVTFSQSDAVALNNAGKFSMHVINMYKDDVTELDAMIATRLAATFYKISGSTDNVKSLNECGTEVIENVLIYGTSTAGGTPNVLGVLSQQYISVTTANSISTTGYFTFDWAPQMYRYAISENNVSNISLLFDIQNYSVISSDALGTQHGVAYSSLLALVDWQ